LLQRALPGWALEDESLADRLQEYRRAGQAELERRAAAKSKDSR